MQDKLLGARITERVIPAIPEEKIACLSIGSKRDLGRRCVRAFRISTDGAALAAPVEGLYSA